MCGSGCRPIIWRGLIEAVGEMDLSAFYAAYRADRHGRAAYEPSLMVALVLYAFATRQRSSRAIERHCRQDVAYRVITGNLIPITRRSRASSAAMSGRWPSCSARCSCAIGPGW
jgi:transposase